MSAWKLSTILFGALAAMGAAAWADPAYDQPMFHGNRQRWGWNSVETALTPAAVASPGFGKLWDSAQFDSFTIGGGTYAPHLYAAPLYLDDVSIASATHSGRFGVVIAATSNGYVYAVNASSSGSVAAGTILWSRFLGTPSLGHDSIPVGVLSTPAADVAASPPRLYVTADTSDPTRSWRVFALDIRSGAILRGWPLELNNATLEPLDANGPAVLQPTDKISQRGALNLSPDRTLLYVPFGSYIDGGTGYLAAIDTGISSGTPRIRSSFAGAPSTDGSCNAGMWSAGGVSIDEKGYVYVTTGNGPPGPVPHNWSQSILAFEPNLPLSLHGTYTPWNHCWLDQNDVDLAGGAPMLLPDLGTATSTPHLLTTGGKQGNAYLIDIDHLPGRLDQREVCNWSGPLSTPTEKSLFGPDPLPYYHNSSGIHIPGPLNVFGPYSEAFNDVDHAKSRSSPAYFRAADGTSYVFYTGSTKTCRQCTEPMPPGIARLKVVTAPGKPAYLKLDAYETTLTLRNPGSPIVTSNGSANAVVWVVETNIDRSAPLTTNTAPHATLYAVDAMTMKVLFASGPDQLWAGAKYYHPVAARGVVFVGTDRISAFGLSGQCPPSASLRCGVSCCPNRSDGRPAICCPDATCSVDGGCGGSGGAGDGGSDGGSVSSSGDGDTAKALPHKGGCGIVGDVGTDSAPGDFGALLFALIGMRLLWGRRRQRGS